MLMAEPPNPSGLSAFVSVALAIISGGALTKLIDKAAAAYEIRAKQRIENSKGTLSEDAAKRAQLSEEETHFRADLRQQIADLRAQMTTLTTEIKEWREKYYQSIAMNLELNAKYTALTSEHEELKADYAELTKEYHELKAQFEALAVELKAMKGSKG